MSRLEVALRDLVGRLIDLGARFAVVGGLAVSARTEPRFTRDADVCVAVHTDAEAEALIQRLRQEGYDVRALIEQEAVGRIAMVRLVTTERDAQGVVLDLLFASSGIESEIVDTAEVVEIFEGIRVPLATVPSLLAQKVLARDDVERPQDRVDIAKLLGVASDGDLVEAERLLVLVESRGFARQRNLIADLRRLRDEFEDA
jgi:predicted nucleotidyltransferase